MFPYTEDELNDLIDEWHESDTTLKIWEYIKITEMEWCAYAQGKVTYRKD